jgi:two-component system, LuxR family, secretion system response regulator SsrB
VSGAPRPRVLAADDHTVMLRAIRRLLEPSCEVVGLISDGAQALDAVTRLTPDVLVLDLFMPGVNGLEICHDVKRVSPRTKIVVFTAFDGAGVRQTALAAGASAFVPKQLPETLLAAIHEAEGIDERG